MFIDTETLGIGKTILLGQIGSKAYGTDTLESDDDYMGVVVPPLPYYIGIEHHPEGSELHQWAKSGHIKIDHRGLDNSETNLFEFRRFLNLC